ncbi:hypothetical protein ABZ467_33110 [Streptomyces sp. NPDC005727]|uniref:hypothetical protein n=1 Tax=unclassified Streptomyces TaxID=2593676 RepID=UPI0033DB03A7
MRASLIQLSVDSSDSADERRHRAASLAGGRKGDDLVVLPELWAAGAWSYDGWDAADTAWSSTRGEPSSVRQAPRRRH